MRRIVRYSGRRGRRPLRVCGGVSTPAAEPMRRIVRENGFCYKFAVGEGLAPPVVEAPPHFVRETSNQTRRSVSLPQRGKGDREAVDEVLKQYGISFVDG